MSRRGDHNTFAQNRPRNDELGWEKGRIMVLGIIEGSASDSCVLLFFNLERILLVRMNHIVWDA